MCCLTDPFRSELQTWCWGYPFACHLQVKALAHTASVISVFSGIPSCVCSRFSGMGPACRRTGWEVRCTCRFFIYLVWGLLVVGPVGRFVALAGSSWLSAVNVGPVGRFVVLLLSYYICLSSDRLGGSLHLQISPVSCLAFTLSFIQFSSSFDSFNSILVF